MTASALPVLDLAEFVGGPSRKARSGLAARRLAVFAAGGLVLGLGGAWSQGWLAPAAEGPLPSAVAPVARHTVAEFTVDDRKQIVAEGLAAEERNEAIPFAEGAAIPMRAFRLDAPVAMASSALKCLTQAIYYEAATEPLAGRRAVAQVVLNRVRHPAYPKSVCGVVYQGAQLSTGCQFSFTCDGSLLRPPMARPWREAEMIARQALAGHVEPEVGTATHYHADYVLPRWAFEMDKITRLGRHLFYRFEGTWGRPGFFAGTYSGQESIPDLDFGRLKARLLAAQGNLAVEPAFTPGLTVAPSVTDRHAANDVGGRLDTTRTWRLTIPDPVAASSRYRNLVSDVPSPGAAANDAAAADGAVEGAQ